MDGWGAIGLRFVAYADLMLLAGLALGGGLGRHAPAINPRLLGWLAALGVVITLAQFAATCLAMTGNDMSLLDRDMLTFMAFDTAMGISHIVRVASLGLLAGLLIIARPARPVVAALAVVALGSLAWSGHAGASEAALGSVHRSSDIAHLIAGAVWIAALVMFARILLFDAEVPGAVPSAVTALERFSGVGSIIVGAIVVTGLINLLAIVGIDGLTTIFSSIYGWMLLLKLALFGCMLGLAAFNRWRLVPGIRTALGGGEQGAAVFRMRRAIIAETVLGFLVLAVVAILGTLSPVE